MPVNPKIVKYFIKSSPVGEVGLIIQDLCHIIDKEALQTDAVKQALREYFEEHKYHIKLPDGRTAMVTDLGRNNPIFETCEGEEGEEPAQNMKVVADFVYYDQQAGVKFSFDPYSL